MTSLTFDAWLRRRRMVAESTIDIYEYSLRRIEKHADKHRDEIEMPEVEAFLRNGYSHRSKELALIAFRLYRRYAATHRGIPLDPELLEIRLRKKRRPIQPAFSIEQTRALLEAVRTPVEARIVFPGFYAGLRVGEMVKLDTESFRGELFLVPANKGNESFPVPMHPELICKSDLILQTHPHRHTVYEACKRLRGVVNLPFTPQWLRRTFSQRLRKLGVAGDVIDALLGHSVNSSVLASHYTAVTWEQLVEAVNKLTY